MTDSSSSSNEIVVVGTDGWRINNDDVEIGEITGEADLFPEDRPPGPASGAFEDAQQFKKHFSHTDGEPEQDCD